MHVGEMCIHAVNANGTCPRYIIHLIRLANANSDIEALATGPFTDKLTSGYVGTA